LIYKFFGSVINYFFAFFLFFNYYMKSLISFSSELSSSPSWSFSSFSFSFSSSSKTISLFYSLVILLDLLVEIQAFATVWWSLKVFERRTPWNFGSFDSWDEMLRYLFFLILLSTQSYKKSYWFNPVIIFSHAGTF